MAYFEKRGKKWRVQVFHLGQRVSKTFKTKTEAFEWAADKEKSLDDFDRGVLPNKTFAEMCDRYSLEVSPTREGGRWEKLRLAKIARTALFRHRVCNHISSDDIGRWRDSRLSEVQPASVRREMELLNAVFERARKEWKWVRVNPLKDTSRPAKSKPRRRGIKQGEINQILRDLGWHGEVRLKKHTVAVAFLLGIETAMRAGELLSLRPETVNLKDRVAHLPKTKNGDARDVPLSQCAVDLLKLVDCKIPLNSKTLDSNFRKYRTVDNLHFHDTRSEAISRLSKKMDVLELAQMVGHRDLRSLLFYYRRSASDIAKKL